METIKLYELAKEASRSMRFIDDVLSVVTFGGWTDVHCVIIKYMVEEKEHVRKGDDIDFTKKIERQSIFGKVSKEQEMVDVEGKILVLSRKDGFLEIDVTGRRYTPTILRADVEVVLKDPVRRNVAYVQEKYPDAYDLLIEEMKRIIQVAVAVNVKKLSNLSRIIDYIKSIDKPAVQVGVQAVKGADDEPPKDAGGSDASASVDALVANVRKLHSGQDPDGEKQKSAALAMPGLNSNGMDSGTYHRHTTI